jgi:hypothetical protein
MTADSNMRNWNATVAISAGSNYVQFYCNDTFDNWNSSELITFFINNAPSNVTLYFPQDGEHITTRTPNLTWFNATDLDSHNLTFWVQVDEDPSFTSPEVNGVNKTGIAPGTNLSNYTVETPLDIIYAPYYWRVRVYDGIEWSNWSAIWNFTIDSTSIILVNGTVNFTTLEPLQSDNTTDDSPTPFLVENQGNVFVNVSVYSQGSLWKTAPLGTDKFRFKAGNSSELDSFDWALSKTSWTNMPNITNMVVAISRLNYNNSNDTAELEIFVEVPLDEPPGTKNATVVFESEQA